MYLKSTGGDTVRVRPPLAPHREGYTQFGMSFLCFNNNPLRVEIVKILPEEHNGKKDQTQDTNNY